MAELLGTAASVVQVAEAGFSLATTLYAYAKAVKGAEQDIKKIARDVKLTAKVLKKLHAQLQEDRDTQNCTEEAVQDLEEVLEGCREAFIEVDDALTKSIKTGPDGKTVMSMAEKLKWPLRSNKLAVLRANLEKLKTTLLLMLTVLAYGSKISQHRAAVTVEKAELTLDKLQIQNLVEAKDEATQRYEELSDKFQDLVNQTTRSLGLGSNTADADAGASADEASMQKRASEDDSAIQRETGEHANISTPSINAIAMFTAPPKQDPCEWKSLNTPTADSQHSVAIELRRCATAVNRLTSTIDAATIKWQSDRILERDAIATTFSGTADIIQSLYLYSSTGEKLPSDTKTAVDTVQGLPSRPRIESSPSVSKTWPRDSTYSCEESEKHDDGSDTLTEAQQTRHRKRNSLLNFHKPEERTSSQNQEEAASKTRPIPSEQPQYVPQKYLRRRIWRDQEHRLHQLSYEDSYTSNGSAFNHPNAMVEALQETEAVVRAPFQPPRYSRPTLSHRDPRASRNGTLNGVPFPIAERASSGGYSSDSDCEAAQGLVMMRMAEEEGSRRQRCGEQRRFGRTHSCSRDKAPHGSDSDDHANVETTPYGDGSDSQMTFSGIGEAQEVGDVGIEKGDGGSDDDDADDADADADDADDADDDDADDADDDRVLDRLLRRWVGVAS